MSLNAWEQDALDSIKNGLADSDPALVARLAMFTRLASGEAMPVREKIHAASKRMTRRPDRRPPARRAPARKTTARRTGRVYQRLGLQWTMLLVWLVTTTALIAAALASSRVGGHFSCTGTWGALCDRASSAPQAAQPVP
jgi:hypothetical protein